MAVATAPKDLSASRTYVQAYVSSQFILGLIAGEGTFSFSTQKGKGRFNVYIQPEFSMGMSERDIIEVVDDTLDFGYVEYRNDGMVVWRVTSGEDREKLIEFVERNKVGLFEDTEKHESYKKWKYLVENRVELMKTREGVKEIIEIAHSINPRGKKTSNSKQELFQIVDESEQYFCEVQTKTGPCENPVKSKEEKCYAHR